MRRSFPRQSAKLVFIRGATPDDVPLMVALEQQAQTAAHWSAREYNALFSPEAPRRVALIAAAEGDASQISGLAIARCGQDEWEIENVVVAEEQRRGGSGTALVQQLLQKAREAGATSVLLEVRESNTAARRLYEKLGFSEIARRPKYYREPSEDALVLKISIAVA